MRETKKLIRCAIYTRKSTEEGLEQDFNSLDAQREACEAYIKSQMHEGWVLVKKHYNDGGFSGGTLERPAVKDLFKDIEAGEVDIVVVYKVDRLTRSLMDFSKIVELFDKQNASFVSITQHFNTTTSMGRLTLNILLSFAQFEREVTGERIRDKVAASKKKGMWMGGRVPIGYLRIDKKLEIDSIHSATVKTIFEKYLEIQSVTKLKQYLQDTNIKSASGLPFAKGNLYKILSNKIYIALITHKNNTYSGEHKPIIDFETFEKVQKQLQENRIGNSCNTKSASNSLLAGKIYDDKNNRMSPSHSNTKNKRYRYYVSQALIKAQKSEAGSVTKIPAGEVEKFVVESIKEFLLDSTKLQKYIENFNVIKQKSFFKTLNGIQDFSNPRLIRAILDRVVISKNSVEITLCEKTLIKTLENLTVGAEPPEESKSETSMPIVILQDVKITRTSQSGNVLIISSSNNPAHIPNPYLIHAIVKSHCWNRLLIEGKVKSIKEIQEREELKDPTYVRDILNLKFLSPILTEQILNGTEPKDLSIQRLFTNYVF